MRSEPDNAAPKPAPGREPADGTGAGTPGMPGASGVPPAADASRRPHVVIVGGGFAGMAAARELRTAPVDVTLVDHNAYSVFQPLLYQVATAGLNPGDVTYFLRAAHMRQRNLRVRQGEVTGVDVARRRVTFGDGWAMDYDYLVIAAGASVNYFDTPGAADHTRTIYTRPQALEVRDEIFTRLQHAAAAGREGQELAIVVVGGGATGVEMAGALAEWRNDAMAAVYPELDSRRTRIVLVEMGSELLTAFAPRLRRYARRALLARGVELRLQTAVAAVTSKGVELPEGFLTAGVVVWAAGVQIPPAVSGWGLPQGSGGRIQVDEQLQVRGQPGVFAAGDIAIGPASLPQLAQPAIQHGRHVGRQIARLVRGDDPRPFRYRDKGTMATIGRFAAVAEIGLPGSRSLKLSGPVAWLLWLGVHIVMLLGNRNRFATLANLTTRYFAPSHRSNPIVGDVPLYRRRSPAEYRTPGTPAGPGSEPPGPA